jgi:hypothetical protein
MPRVGFEITTPSVLADEDSSCLRLRGYRDRRNSALNTIHLCSLRAREQITQQQAKLWVCTLEFLGFYVRDGKTDEFELNSNKHSANVLCP